MIFLLVSLFYGLWLVLTLLSQTHYKWNFRIFSFDLFRLIPVWTFFAPNPGVTDYNLLLRTRLPDGTLTGFQRIPLRGSRNFVIAVFNPKRRLQKALHDHVQSISILVENGGLTEENKEHIKLTFNYISILNYCSRLPSIAGSSALQFMILESSGYHELQKPRIILNSEFHRL